MARKSIGKVVKQLCHALRQRHIVKENQYKVSIFHCLFRKLQCMLQ